MSWSPKLPIWWLLVSGKKFDFKLTFFKQGWFSISFVSKGYETKEIENQPHLNQNSPEIKFDLKQIFDSFAAMQLLLL